MGVTGVGKTTIGRLVAAELGLPFHDGDDFHSEENRRKMAAAVPLTERDRRPWLRNLARHISAWEASGGAVLACSALRRRYRKILADAADGDTVFVFLDGDEALIRSRLVDRSGHYMPPSLLDSQLEALEPPADGEAIRVDVDGTPVQIARSIVAEIRTADAHRAR